MTSLNLLWSAVSRQLRVVPYAKRKGTRMRVCSMDICVTVGMVMVNTDMQRKRNATAFALEMMKRNAEASGETQSTLQVRMT